jgi:nucleotide-binding universal stress UspA family protein
MSADPNIDATTYAVILAALDLDLPPQGVLAASSSLAQMFDARVVGAVAGECSIGPYFAEGAVADKFLAEAAADLREQMKALERQFRNAHAGRGQRIEWRCAERLPDGFMVAAASAADLIVAGRPSPQANLMRGPDVANLMMQAGRPVLVMQADAAEFTCERVLVAWKDTREARRAVHDALPILRHADEVQVLAIHESEASSSAVLSGANDVVTWLARHGVTAVATAQPDYEGVGRAIEGAATDMQADVVVAGAFGHSRFMEWLLGGVTRYLLRSPNMNVLFSH